MSSSSPCVILWASVVLAMLPGCERATPSTTSSALDRSGPQQVIAPLVPRREGGGSAEAPAASLGAGGGTNLPSAAASEPSAAVSEPSAVERSPTAAEPGAGAAARAAQKATPGSGAPSETCVNGWIAPGRGNPLRKAALDMIRARKSERFVVEEMRYFRGPEDAEVIGPQREVERWYVKAYSTGRDGRRQRWLVRRAAVGRGIDAVAEFDSTGYAPGTWKRPDASDDSVSDPFQRPCDRQSAGEKCMGLPYAVLGCLDGT